MNKATIEELAYLMKKAKDNQLPQPIFFLGAGASRSGGIPLANEIVTDILDKFCDSPRIKNLQADSRGYTSVMNCLTQFQRNVLLNEYIERAKINVTHIYLAQLLIDGFVDYILTVNFDNLILRALALLNFFPPTYDLSNIKDLTTSNFNKKSVVYLHGQHHGLWLLNTVEEMKKVKKLVPAVFDSIKDKRPWVFIGYSGNDPMFNHIANLGSFANGLYWVTFYNELPNEQVCRNLLNKPLKNSFLISGYDSDSFMLRLNTELGLSQPMIFDKPFTSLEKIVNNIVDINDQEHFRGVRKRMEIVKHEISASILQFENGSVLPGAKLQEEYSLNLIKKQIIEMIIKRDFDPDEIEVLESKGKLLDNKEINSLLSELFSNWANAEFYLKHIKGKPDYYLCYAKYKKATELNPQNDFAFHNWGNSLAELAMIKNDQALFEESFEKYATAVQINNKKDSIYNNWANAIADLAKLKCDTALYQLSFEKYELATVINPRYDTAYNNWGLAMSELAMLKNEVHFFELSIEKFRRAIEINPNKKSAYKYWGNTLAELYKLTGDIAYKIQSECKYQQANEIPYLF